MGFPADEATLERLLSFIKTPGTEAEVAEAIAFASFENMKRLESGDGFRLRGGRFAPRDRSNPDSYKVRRGKVGGYRDYFTDDEAAEIESLIDAGLSPVFGYRADKAAKPAGSA